MITLIADTHGMLPLPLDHLDVDAILCEQLQDVTLSPEEVLKALRTGKVPGHAAFHDVEEVLRCCALHGIPAVGIDLPRFGFDDRLQAVVDGAASTPADDARLDALAHKRALLHVEKVKASAGKRIAVVVGAWHLRDGAPLRTALRHYTLRYVADASGRMVFAPAAGLHYRTREF